MANLAGRRQADALSRMILEKKKGMAFIFWLGVLTMGQAWFAEFWKQRYYRAAFCSAACMRCGAQIDESRKTSCSSFGSFQGKWSDVNSCFYRPFDSCCFSVANERCAHDGLD